jgi:hypothetical protein
MLPTQGQSGRARKATKPIRMREEQCRVLSAGQLIPSPPFGGPDRVAEIVQRWSFITWYLS